MRHKPLHYKSTALLFCRQILPLTLFVLIVQHAFGQFNDTVHYHIVLNSTGSVNRANNGDSFLLNNALNFGIKQKSVTLNATGNWVYGRQNNVLTNNDFSSALFLNLYKTFPHFYYWGLVNYNTSYSLKINNEVLAGAGVAYSVLDKKNAYINLSDGVLYDQSDLLVNDIYHTYRNSFRLMFRFAVDDRLTIEGSNFFQNSFDNGNDYIIRSITTIGLKLRKWISFTTALTYNKMNITSSNNLIFTYGLVIDKYF